MTQRYYTIQLYSGASYGLTDPAAEQDNVSGHTYERARVERRKNGTVLVEERYITAILLACLSIDAPETALLIG